MNAYGAVDNRPKGGVLAGAVVGVLVIAAVIGAIIYYQTSDRQKRDAMDYETLNAEYDALATAAAPLHKLADAAKPDTPVDDYNKLLLEARTAYDRYTSAPRRTERLPSGRPWPGQFAAADKLLTESFQHFASLPYYLGEREKIVKLKDPKKTTGTADADIENVADLANEPLSKLDASLDHMKEQRNGHSWEYGK